MIHISDEQFSTLIAEVMDELPQEHIKRLKNVAIIIADEPTAEERETLQLRDDQNLYGLYQGIPLSQRQGYTGTMLPDKITLYKIPLMNSATSYSSFRAQVKHTLWHEIAHYFGLNHTDIYNLEKKRLK